MRFEFIPLGSEIINYLAGTFRIFFSGSCQEGSLRGQRAREKDVKTNTAVVDPSEALTSRAGCQNCAISWRTPVSAGEKRQRLPQLSGSTCEGNWSIFYKASLSKSACQFDSVARNCNLFIFNWASIFLFVERPVITNCLKISIGHASGWWPLWMALLCRKLFRVIKWHFFTNLNFYRTLLSPFFNLFFSIFTARKKTADS